MKRRKIERENDFLYRDSRYRGHDPLQAAIAQSSSFNAAWLKNGDSLNLTQRVGFTVFSLFFVAAGLFLLDSCAAEWQGQNIFMAALFCVAGLFALCFGVLGLRNVLRFPLR